MAILLVILGAIPYLLGYAMNWYMMEYPDTLPPLRWIAVLFLLFWGLLAFLCNRKGAHSKQVILFLNLFAALNLVLLGVQEVILGAYWSNWLGLVTTVFYLPHFKSGLLDCRPGFQCFCSVCRLFPFDGRLLLCRLPSSERRYS